MTRVHVAASRFLTKANTLHNRKYTYDLKTYLGSREVMTMYCNEHGTFLQRPADHLQGQQCPLCARDSAIFKLTKTHEQFIKQMHSIFDTSLLFS